MKQVLVIFLVLASLSSYADQFSLSSNEHIDKFLSEIEHLLPPRLKHYLNRKISLQFINMGSATTISPEYLCSAAKNRKKYHFAYVKKTIFKTYADISTIYINKLLLPFILQGDEQSPVLSCRSKNMYTFVKTVVLHELAHLYDFSMKSPEDDSLLNRCEQYLGDICINSNRKSGISDTSRYLYLAGFKLNVFANDNVEDEQVFFSPQRKKGKILRSPDPYEYTNQYEHFAVNVPLFLTDKNYRCRRPRLYHFFQEIFQFTPFPESTCNINYSVPIESNGHGQLVSIDPARVYRIDYLLAGQGPAMMSRWGHAMFRIVLCSPKRKKVSAKCLKDVNSHVVMGFLANISELSMNTIKGLTGKYPSTLHFSSFPQIIHQYNTIEFRDLYSYPLDLSPSQKVEFIEHALEVYWQYSGKYYFTSNNCAVEALDFLQFITPTVDRAVTPKGVKNILINNNLISNLTAEAKISNTPSSTFFKSKYQKYQQAYLQLRDYYSLKVSFEDFFKCRNQKLFDQVMHSEDKKIVYDLYLLQNISLRRAFNKLQEYIISNEEYFPQLVKEFRDLQKDSSFVLTHNYGLPLVKEITFRQRKKYPKILGNKEIKLFLKKDHHLEKIYRHYAEVTKQVVALQHKLLNNL